jgi:Uma2 family endonuclease
MSETVRLLTAEEFERMPEDDLDRYELVEGRLVRMSPVSFDQARIVPRLIFLLQRHLDGTRLGLVVTEMGFTLASNPDTVRAPDIAFLKGDRLPARGTRGFPKQSPDAVIEVLSPDDRPSEMRRKIAQYLHTGVALVIVIDPKEATATSFRPSKDPVTLRGEDDLLDLSDVIPGFRCSLRDIFE